jgi:hypothetical protein
MNDLDTLNDVEASLTPSAVRQWLAAEHWGKAGERAGIAELWARPDTLSSQVEQVLVPLATSYADYNRRFRGLLSDLQSAYSFSLSELAEAVASVSTDMFFVRLDQDSADNTIPFKQATKLLASIQKMVRAAATSTASPSHSHTGRRPAVVNEFIEEDLRFGHTKHGSFIITVAARLDDPNEATDTDVATQGDEVKPFSRRVMETLAVSLAATKHHLATGDNVADYEGFDSAVQSGMSLELVQSLIEVTDVAGLSQVDLSFQWASGGPTPPRGIEKVTIEADELPELNAVRDRLVLKEEPTEITLIGRVAGLARDESGAEEESSIILEAELNGKLRNIKVVLSSRDYDWAIYAHAQRIPFSVTGTPVRRQRWVLEGDVVADTRFLESVAQQDRDAGRLSTAPLASGVESHDETENETDDGPEVVS